MYCILYNVNNCLRIGRNEFSVNIPNHMVYMNNRYSTILGICVSGICYEYDSYKMNKLDGL